MTTRNSIRVADCMTASPLTVSPQTSLREALELMMRKHVRHLPVVDAGAKLVGMVTDRDLRRVSPSPLAPSAREEAMAAMDTTSVEKVMVREPTTVRVDQPLSDAVKVMVEKKYGALPVVQGGRLVGILSQIDVLRQWLVEHP